MSDYVVTLTLNQQQLELLHRTIAQGAAADLPGLVRLALREYAGRREQADKAPGASAVKEAA